MDKQEERWKRRSEQHWTKDENAKLLRQRFNEHVDGITIEMVEGADEVAKVANNEAKNKRADFEAAGGYMVQGIAAGMRLNKQAVISAAFEMVKATLDATNKASDSHSHLDYLKRMRAIISQPVLPWASCAT